MKTQTEYKVESMQGKLLKIFITKDDKDKTKVIKNKISVDEDGIKEDKFYKKDQNRSILITSIQSYELSAQNSIELEHGMLGENILIDINPYHLKHKDKVVIGDTVLEITQHCTLCKGLSSVNSKLPKLLKDDRGIFARYISGDKEINTGATVKFIQGR
jgi:MOSC domain-containing protein YiiM